jgi:excisionase family DNA binding protein
MTTDDEFWTVDEVATSLRVSNETVRRWIRSGHLKASRVGSSPRSPLRIRQSEVDRLANRNPTDRG